MPTYDYECTKCAHAFEAFQKMSDPPLKFCPKCKAPVRRLIGAGAGIIFKGSGFYATDYRKQVVSDTSSKDKTSCPKENNSTCKGCPHAE